MNCDHLYSGCVEGFDVCGHGYEDTVVFFKVKVHPRGHFDPLETHFLKAVFDDFNGGFHV